MNRWHAAAALCLVVLGAGCDDGAPAGSEPSEEKRAPLSDDPLEAAIQKAARERAPYMDPVGKFHRGELELGESKDVVSVLKDPYCYSIFSQGGPDVDDLDLFLFDPTGVPVHQDSATDHHPVLGLSDPICPPKPGLYRIRVKMYRGHGEFALHLYRGE